MTNESARARDLMVGIDCVCPALLLYVHLATSSHQFSILETFPVLSIWLVVTASLRQNAKAVNAGDEIAMIPPVSGG